MGVIVQPELKRGKMKEERRSAELLWITDYVSFLLIPN